MHFEVESAKYLSLAMLQLAHETGYGNEQPLSKKAP